MSSHPNPGCPPEIGRKMWEIWDFIQTKYGTNIGFSKIFYLKYGAYMGQVGALPILFNIYANDISEIMKGNTSSEITLDEDNKINVLMYAEDLILLSETKDGLQKQIDKLHIFCAKWKLDINVKKTKVMVFNRGNRLIKSKFYINNVLIENVKTFKYMGFTISAKNCSFTPTLEDLSI